MITKSDPEDVSPKQIEVLRGNEVVTHLAEFFQEIISLRGPMKNRTVQASKWPTEDTSSEFNEIQHLWPSVDTLSQDAALRIVHRFRQAKNGIPDGERCKANRDVIGPLFSMISESSEEGAHQEVYQNLLRKVMDRRQNENIRPSVIKVMKDLCSDKLLLLMLIEWVHRTHEIRIDDRFDYNHLREIADAADDYNSRCLGIDYEALAGIKLIAWPDQSRRWEQFQFTLLGRRVMETALCGVRLPAWSLPSGKKPRGYHFFIGYASQDSEIAGELKRTLADKGMTCFLAKEDILVGGNWAQEIRDALRVSHRVLFLLTPHSFDRRWLHIEVGAAWLADKEMVPVLMGVQADDLREPIRGHHAREIRQERQRQDIVELVNELARRASS